ncbi:CRISPR-associated helicase, Cas3 family [Lachnospiraceae bacterium KH1T2]|nr:CRISPR-associated helicase, Cas3 family [Lachnospiraceae bacterium KH1T2]
MEEEKLYKAAVTLWGKADPYKSLLHHMIDAGVCAIEYLSVVNKSLLELMSEKCNMEHEMLLHVVGYLVACHDIGKAHPDFQSNTDVFMRLPDEVRKIIKDVVNKETTKISFRHEKYSSKVLNRIWEDTRELDENFVDNITSVISDHHQKAGSFNQVAPNLKKEYEYMQDCLENIVYSLFCPIEFPEECEDWSVFCEALNGILILSDWIASNENFSVEDSLDDREYFDNAKKTAKKNIYSIGFVNSKLPDPKNLNELYGWENNHMRPMQTLVNEAADESPIFTIIEDSPGAGKTEAAVYLAVKIAKEYKKDGFYFALPTSATANQMWERLNNIFGKFEIPNFRLTHGMAWSVIEEENNENFKYGSEDEIGQEWLRPTRRALLSQFAVGTVDQIMMAVMNIRFRQLRMLGLTNKVIIIDEVHAYDAYMSRILDRLLEWCRVMNIPVILLSATLPNEKKRNFIEAYTGAEIEEELEKDYPLLTYVKDNMYEEKHCVPFRTSQYSIHLLDILNDIEKTADKAIELVKGGGNLCLMLNTVNDAQQVYKILKEKVGTDSKIELMLYHARFKAKDRANIERRCLEEYSGKGQRPKCSILVCTQVVEQSLDVDFDILMTQICPIDLLVQRLGREWRHELKRPIHVTEAECYVLVGDIEKSSIKKIYVPYILHKTEEYLRNKNVLVVPDDLRDAIAYVYDSSEESLEYIEKFTEELLKANQAEGSVIEEPDESLYYLADKDSIFLSEDESDNLQVATRLGEKSVRTVLCSSQLYERFMEKPQLKKNQNEMLENSVSLNLRNISYKDCVQNGALKGMFIAVSDTDEYKVSEETEIIYDSEFGAIVKRG